MSSNLFTNNDTAMSKSASELQPIDQSAILCTAKFFKDSKKMSANSNDEKVSAWLTGKYVLTNMDECSSGSNKTTQQTSGCVIMDAKPPSIINPAPISLTKAIIQPLTECNIDGDSSVDSVDTAKYIMQQSRWKGLPQHQGISSCGSIGGRRVNSTQSTMLIKRHCQRREKWLDNRCKLAKSERTSSACGQFEFFGRKLVVSANMNRIIGRHPGAANRRYRLRNRNTIPTRSSAMKMAMMRRGQQHQQHHRSMDGDDDAMDATSNHKHDGSTTDCSISEELAKRRRKHERKRRPKRKRKTFSSAPTENVLIN